MKKFFMTFVSGALIASGVSAVNKTVWSPEEKIGKTTTWEETEKAGVKIENQYVEIDLKGSEWSGMGLNWEGYWPEDAGLRAADFKKLIIQLEVEGRDADALQITLKDNKSKDSTSVFIKQYCENKKIPQGKFYVEVPMDKLITEKSNFETGIVWEIMFHAWTPSEKEIKIKVYKISFE